MITTQPLREPTVLESKPGRTLVAVQTEQGRPQVRLRSGLLRAQQVTATAGWTKIGLIATTALLLADDHVEVTVELGPGARLWLFDAAGTVAYNGRGRPASWSVDVRVAEGAELIMSGEPFVVGAGAEVTRELNLEVAGGGRALIRDTVIIGRSGERGGAIRNRTRVSFAAREVCREDQRLGPEIRSLPGILGDQRVLDSITAVGTSAPAGITTADSFALLDDAGTVSRWIGSELAASPLRAVWEPAQWCAA